MRQFYEPTNSLYRRLIPNRMPTQNDARSTTTRQIDPSITAARIFELVAYSLDEFERYFEHVVARVGAIAASGVIFSAYGIEVRTNSVAIGLVVCDQQARVKVRDVLGEGPWIFYEQPFMSTE